MGFVATAIALAGAASAGSSIYNAKSAEKANKKAAEDAAQKNAAAIQAVKDDQTNAGSKASATVKRRINAQSQTVYTSPLGLAGEAGAVRKTLLGE